MAGRKASVPAGIALGSNLGDRLANLRAGREALLRWHEGPVPAASSPVYETEPVDCPPGSAPFLNAVVEIRTSLQPPELLAACRAVEVALGRDPDAARHAPRPLDLDLLYAGDREMETAALVLPHPRMESRRFVLQPLSDIRPGLRLPGQPCSIAELLARLPANPAATLFAADW
jgi:2-amino-4-hydroxy-6-hydroxymethyldihydropteridine diphosphokinase